MGEGTKKFARHARLSLQPGVLRGLFLPETVEQQLHNFGRNEIHHD